MGMTNSNDSLYYLEQYKAEVAEQLQTLEDEKNNITDDSTGVVYKPVVDDGKLYIETEAGVKTSIVDEQDLSETVQDLEAQIEAKAPAFTYGTEDLVAGTSPLPTGTLYFMYEE